MKLSPTLAVLLASLLPATQGQVTCNSLNCVTNAVCNTQTMQCECDGANSVFGNGRVVCAGNDRCVCGALADPHYFLFDLLTGAQMLKVNLPCSVVLARTVTYAAPDPICLIDLVLAHPETRGSGQEQYIRVFVAAVEVRPSAPSAFIYTVSASGTVGGPVQEVYDCADNRSVVAKISNEPRIPLCMESVLSLNEASIHSQRIQGPVPLPATVTTGVEDGFNTATLTSCSNLKVGYNSTYGGAYLDIKRGASAMGTGLCGNCDNTADELPIGSNNFTELIYFLKHMAVLADQVGDFATQCGAIQTSANSGCSDPLLITAADVCGRYLTSFGICLINKTLVTDFGQLLETKFRSCLNDICDDSTMVSLTNWCDQLTTDSASCPLGVLPLSCPVTG